MSMIMTSSGGSDITLRLKRGFDHVSNMVKEFEFKGRFYDLSASKAIFRARTYSHTTYSVSGGDYLNETRRKPTTKTRYPTLFDKWHGIFYMTMHAQIRLGMPSLYLPSLGSLGGKCPGWRQIRTGDLSVHRRPR